MALTTTQRAYVQRNLGITTDETVFTNNELDDIYDETGSDLKATVYSGWLALMANAAKFFNYTAGQSKVERAAVFDHVKAMVEFWKDESRTAANQMVMLGLTEVPPRWKNEPDGSSARLRRTLNRGC